jgi:hypothetical protein
LRSFLSSYYYSKEGKFDFNQLLNITQFPALMYSDVKSYTYFEAAKNWINNQKKFFTKEKLFFLKTHNSLQEYFGYRFTKSSETLGAIYIVRDPRNVVSSMCNHYSMNFNEMYNKMIDENASLSLKNSEGDLSNFSFLGSWSNHYKSWKNNFEFKTLFIKYEDLEENAYDEFWKIVKFIEELKGKKEPINKRRFENSINSTSFSNIKRKEKLQGFPESLTFKKDSRTNFFNLGFKNKWQQNLPEEISDNIKNKFFNELKELKYE